VNDQAFGLARGRVANGLPTLAPSPGVTPFPRNNHCHMSDNAITGVNLNWIPPEYLRGAWDRVCSLFSGHELDIDTPRQQE
jgi:hypothetical protein